jgi:hypothetical protein
MTLRFSVFMNGIDVCSAKFEILKEKLKPFMSGIKNI